MADLRGFNAEEFEPTQSREPIPAGQYTAVITASEVKQTKKGDGAYLQLIFEIMDGPHAKRLLFSRLNLENPNETAVQIAQQELASICRAVGVMQPSDSVELHNLPLVIQVQCKKRPDTGGITNEIVGYSKRQSPPTQPASPAAPPVTPPWRR